MPHVELRIISGPQVSSIFASRTKLTRITHPAAGMKRLNVKQRKQILPWQKSEQGIEALLIGVVAAAFDLPAVEIMSVSRRAPVAFARQVAIYLAHVGLGLSYTQAGRAFSRDRTTIAHACRVVEERRDDACLDTCLDHLESALRQRLETGTPVRSRKLPGYRRRTVPP